MRAVLLAALGLALTAGPAAAATEIDTVPLEAKAADGVVLRGHVYLPKGRPRPLATVLEFSPYFDGPGHLFEGTDQFSGDGEIAFLLDAGFAVAAVSMRGTGQSDGCMRFGDRTDWTDGAAVVQAIAAQPWSNGSVGMYGHSYDAWSQMMTAAARPPALKAIVPTSGVWDLWSLVTRHGAPLTAGEGSLFPPLFTGLTGHPPPKGINQICPELLQYYNGAFEVSKTGDTDSFFEERDLRVASTPSGAPVMPSFGIISGVNDGHILQPEDMWDRLGADREHWVLGQWGHEVPTAHKSDWHQQVIGWFDHYLRGGPQTVKTGEVEYQDDDDRWHTADRWPPPSTRQVVRLSGDQVVPDGEKLEPVDATFQSADNDPGLRADQPDDKTRLYTSTCGPHQALFVSRPLAADTLLAGNAFLDLTLSSTLPGGNLSVFLWRTKGEGTCPDQSATWFARALMDLRHWKVERHSQDFPIGTPTHVRMRSHPFAGVVHKGERIVVAIGGGSSEIEPDARHPAITVSGGSLDLPVAGAPAAASGRAPLRFRPCASRRHFTIHLRGGLVRARVRVAGGRARVLGHRGHRLRAAVDLRGAPRRVVALRISGVTRSGRHVTQIRRYRTCTRA
jgi:X-Pro dipeptidyl-peptidase